MNLNFLKNKKFFIKPRAINFILFLILIGGFLLVFLVFLKTGKNPVILKRNEIGLNFLTQRERIFNFYIIGIIFLASNYLLIKKIKAEGINLRKIINYANIVIVILLFLISLQIYFLNL